MSQPQYASMQLYTWCTTLAETCDKRNHADVCLSNTCRVGKGRPQTMQQDAACHQRIGHSHLQLLKPGIGPHGSGCTRGCCGWTESWQPSETSCPVHLVLRASTRQFLHCVHQWQPAYIQTDAAQVLYRIGHSCCVDGQHCGHQVICVLVQVPACHYADTVQGAG